LPLLKFQPSYFCFGGYVPRETRKWTHYVTIMHYRYPGSFMTQVFPTVSMQDLISFFFSPLFAHYCLITCFLSVQVFGQNHSHIYSTRFQLCHLLNIQIIVLPHCCSVTVFSVSPCLNQFLMLLDTTVYVPWTIFTSISTLIRNCILLIIPINLQLHSVSIPTILFHFH